MFDADPGEELALVVETARKFALEALQPHLREAEAARGVEGSVHEDYHAIGLAGLELPEAHGGAGLSSVARALVNEELGAADAGAALALDPLGPALHPALEMGLALEPLAAHGARPGSRVVLATDLDGQVSVGGDRVTAELPYVPADRADAVVVLAGDTCACVIEGIAIEPLRGAGLRAAGGGRLRADGPAVATVCDPAGAARARARIRLYVASLLLGVLRATCAFSRDYAQQREAFGRPIAHHQALAFLITDMKMAVDGARLLVHEAAWRLEAGLPAEAAAASALAQCVEASRTVGPDGVQILGGHGFMADYPVEKHMREARALGLLFGGFDAAVEEAGRRVCGNDAPLGLVESALS